MKRLLAAALIVGFCGAAFAADEGAKDEKCGVKKHGLVAHYYKDATNWDGNWEPGSKPQVDPKDWTFTKYHHSRVEPLINHLFIRRGWFSVRWKGQIEVPGKDETDVTFEIWADDGCRLVIDDKVVINDWRDMPEDATDAKRSGTVRLSAGKHKIVVDYFQGESLRKNDHDPIKLYWALPMRGAKKHIVPASALSYTDDDLFPDPGRKDPQGDEFLEQVLENIGKKK